MNKRKHKYTLTGGTLLEVLISLSLLSIVFVMGTMFLQKLTGIQSPSEKFKTQLLVKEALYQPIEKWGAEPEETEKLGRRIIKSVRVQNLDANLYQIEVQAYWGEQLLESRSRMITLSQ